MLTLPATEIHLRLAFCDAVTDQNLLRRYRGLLCESELAQARRFREAADRQRYLLTRALVRTSLSLYVPVHAAEWRFVADNYGRPGVKHPRPVDFTFNVAHTPGAVMLAVARSELGVDIENTRTRAASLTIAERYFSPEEARTLRGLPAEQQQSRFLQLWTLKEAYLKARGRGLSMPLDAFQFQICEPELSFAARAELDDRPARWSFWLLGIGADHIASVCAARTGPQQTASLVAREVVPLLHEERMDYRELARTG